MVSQVFACGTEVVPKLRLKWVMQMRIRNCSGMAYLYPCTSGGQVEGWQSQGMGAIWTMVTRENTPTSLHYIRTSEPSCDPCGQRRNSKLIKDCFWHLGKWGLKIKVTFLWYFLCIWDFYLLVQVSGPQLSSPLSVVTTKMISLI